jgi:hypothetical protein
MLEFIKTHYSLPILDMNYPNVFNIPESVQSSTILLNFIISFIVPIHPYSNLFLLKNFTKKQITFVSSCLSSFPYYLTKFEDIETVQDFLSVVVLYFLQDDFQNHVNKIHFGFEDSLDDIKSYKIIEKIFQRHSATFNPNFHESILHLDIYNHLMERVGFNNFDEMKRIWLRIVVLYCIEYDLDEFTFPLLLT